MLKVSIYRFNPEQDEAPYMQDYDFDTQGKDLMVLDVLGMLKSRDPSISYRRSCREGVCGSDGMNINGKNGLGCITPLSECVKGNKLVIRPLPGLPVIRDLVIDMSQFYAQYKYNHILLMMTRHLVLKDYRLQRIVQNLMASMNVFFVPAAQQAALLFGGTQINSLAQLVFCRHIASWLTQEITILKKDYLI